MSGTRMVSYGVLIGLCFVAKINSQLPEYNSLEMDEFIRTFSFTSIMAYSQITISLYMERESMFSFVCSMFSFSGMLYFFATWGLFHPYATAFEMVGSHWYVLLFSLISFIVSRRQKKLAQQNEA